MARQAILVEGHDDGKVTQEMINVLDDEAIDFFIHWDKKSTTPIFKSYHSKIHFIPSTKVYWGGNSLMAVEIALLKYASEGKYAYYHLVSDSDMPMMTSQHLKSFFNEDNKKEYINFDVTGNSYDWRMKYYYFLEKVALPRKAKYQLQLFLCQLQKILGINRLSAIPSFKFAKGEHWVSISDELLTYLLREGLLDQSMNLFKNTFISDEMWLQSVVENSPFLPQVNVSKKAILTNSRMIDWKRGNPYIYGKNTFSELKKYFNTELAFVRKVDLDAAQLIANELVRDSDASHSK